MYVFLYFILVKIDYPSSLTFPYIVRDTMELSAFQYIAKKNINDTLSYYKHLVFIKIDGCEDDDVDKVYIKMSSDGKGGHKSLSIMMPIDDLAKNTNLQKYYEMSRVAIGKPNLDPNYYSSEDPEKCQAESDYIFIDTIYITEGTDYIYAKKGNTYNSFNLEELKKMKVASVGKIAEFNTDYIAKFCGVSGVSEVGESGEADERVCRFRG